MDYQVPPPDTVQQLAKVARCAFSFEKREDGSEYWTHDGRNAPEWIAVLTTEAHGTMLPDDSRYAFVVEALDALEEADDPDDARDGYECEPYFSRLVEWLRSYAGHRLSYCDDYATEYGYDLNNSNGYGTGGLLQGGHLFERLEVLDMVRGSLEARLATLAAV